MRMWRTMFSISTIASSTRMPVTSVIASRLTRFSEKPIASIAQKVGMIDSGSATRGDDGGANVAQEDEHDDDGEQRALDQRLHRRMIVADLVVDLGVDLGEGHLGVRGLDLREALRDQPIDGDVACALGAGDAEGDDRLVEQAGEGARLGRAVDDRSQFVEAHLAARREARSAAPRGRRRYARRRACGSPAPDRRLRRVRRRDRRCRRGPAR